MPHQKSEDGSQPTFVSMVANSICKILSEKSGRNGADKKTEEEIKWMMIAKTYLTGNQMLEHGFVDRVINSETPINHTNIKSDYKEYQNILNKELFKTTDTMPSQKILNRLKLSEGSDDDAVLAAIARIENDLSVSNKENETISEKLRIANESQEQLQTRMRELQSAKQLIDNSLLDKEKELEVMNKQISDTNEKIKLLENEKLEADNKAKEIADKALEDKAAQLIDGFVTTGKIENNEETIKVWNGMAIRDYDGTKVILDAMKTNMSVPTPQSTGIKNQEEKKIEEGSVEEFRIENRKRLEEKRSTTKKA